ncbi:MAG TPA: efflux RND transporter periplasmic adaptor subunit [Cryomorphaceae bacterium]|nr:efflux RND transporter periplasmic adaptor subunit [Cryomorphaceae bacterium]HCY25313.1 efflux RND transporter periplasmic adaptor subunit [Cryomorphaceae bacterium]|tara:strand:- start:3473 stop:4726 length:1254 start_codon:yes stop_codon:yes gene_type:complete
MKINLKVIIPIAIVLIGGLIVAKKRGWIDTNNDAVVIEIGFVHQRTVVESVTASGKIQPEIEVNMSPEVSGEIIEVNVVDGQYVKYGEVLVKINPDLYESAITRSRAAVNSAKTVLAQSDAALIETKKLWERNQNLFEKGAISQQEFDAAQRSITVAELQRESSKYALQSAKANLDEAFKNLKRTTIIAPISGTVTQLNVELGERVVGTATMTGTEMLRIAELDTMEVLVEVNENDIVKLVSGDTALIEIDAYLGDSFKGVVSEIANSAKLAMGASADQVTNFEVKIRVLNSSYAHLVETYGKNPFRPGMTATVEIITNKVRDALVVPIQAVTVRKDTSTRASSYDEIYGDGDESFEVVFLPIDGNAKLRVVKSGIQDDEYIIIEGLDDSTEVITGPYSAVSRLLKDGAAVKTQDKK